MQLFSAIGFLALVLPVQVEAGPSEGALQAANLRANAQIDPVQVSSSQPVLSWVCVGEGESLFQTAYQVQVGSSPTELLGGTGDLWDSGQVESGEQLQVKYAGRPLEPGRLAFWRVRLWDGSGTVGPWSRVASLGAPLPTHAWSTDQWIGLDALPGEPEPLKPDLDDALWIVPLESVAEAPSGASTFGRLFEVPGDSPVTAAQAWIIADDSYELALNDQTLSGGGNWRVAEPLDLLEWVQSGTNVLRVRVANHAFGPTALRMSLRIDFENGERLDLVTDGRWTLGSSSDEAWLQLGAEEPPAFVVSAETASGIWRDPIGVPGEQKLTPPRYLRNSFEAPTELRRATLYLASLGFADAYLNGELVSTRFVSDWTDYNKRVTSLAFDVTGQVRAGDNAIGLVLSDGWYSGFIGWGGTDDHWGSQPRAAAQLVLERADGSQTTIRTGADWVANTGPLLSADMLAGEAYDARIDRAEGFSSPGFDAADWVPVSVGTDEVESPVEPSPGPPIDVFAEFQTVSITEPVPGTWIFDLGRNIAGVARLQIHGQAGQRIQLRFAERLNPDGTLYTTNLRGARAIDEYICSGEGLEVWEPRFTFHGFQYVEVTGLEGAPTDELITGVAIGSLTPRVGRFECSSEMLNQLASNVYWTQRANFLSVPTDCPQRDERLGWTGDAQVYVRTAGLWCDVQPFFGKWLTDLSDATTPDGNPPKVAPVLLGQGDGGPAWSDAATICPWEIYRMYGDRALLARQYPDMRAYVDFNTGRAGEDRSAPKQFHCFGDWLNLDDPTPNELIFVTYWAESARIVTEAARVLGYSDDVATYTGLRDEIVAAFNRDHVGSDGRISGDSQTAYVLALRHGMVQGQRREQAIDHLVRTLEDRDWHLATGFVGTKDLMLVLDRIGRNDIAYRLALHEDYPSWGFAIQHGATSIWERWDGWTPDRGFQDPGMNSFSHYSFGAVYRWMVETIGGIRLTEPGYASFEVRPVPGGDLAYASVAVDSIRGRIESSWELRDGKIVMDVTVPANCRCSIVVPTLRPAEMVLSGTKADLVPASSRLNVGSGRYHIEAPFEG